MTINAPSPQRMKDRRRNDDDDNHPKVGGRGYFFPSLSLSLSLSLEDSAFIEMEKSSDERAFELFEKYADLSVSLLFPSLSLSRREYLPELRPYFHHRGIARQLLEHLWSNMIESSKVSFLKKMLKDPHLATLQWNQSNNDGRSPSSSTSRHSRSLFLGRKRLSRRSSSLARGEEILSSLSQ